MVIGYADNNSNIPNTSTLDLGTVNARLVVRKSGSVAKTSCLLAGDETTGFVSNDNKQLLTFGSEPITKKVTSITKFEIE